MVSSHKQLLDWVLTCRRFTKLRIFNTFDYKYTQNLVSKNTNSDKSQTPQFRETAVGSCFFYIKFLKIIIVIVVRINNKIEILLIVNSASFISIFLYDLKVLK